jgi:hypothetical protein
LNNSKVVVQAVLVRRRVVAQMVPAAPDGMVEVGLPQAVEGRLGHPATDRIDKKKLLFLDRLQDRMVGSTLTIRFCL